MDYIIKNSNEILIVILCIASAIGYIYGVSFISKIRKSGTDREKRILGAASIDALKITCCIFSFVLILAVAMYLTGLTGLTDEIEISGSGFPVYLLGIIPLIFYNTYGYRKRLIRD